MRLRPTAAPSSQPRRRLHPRRSRLQQIRELWWLSTVVKMRYPEMKDVSVIDDEDRE
ncbi:hypothetical protein RYX36_012816 [Vicia faba]